MEVLVYRAELDDHHLVGPHFPESEMYLAKKTKRNICYLKIHTYLVNNLKKISENVN